MLYGILFTVPEDQVQDFSEYCLDNAVKYNLFLTADNEHLALVDVKVSEQYFLHELIVQDEHAVFLDERNGQNRRAVFSIHFDKTGRLLIDDNFIGELYSPMVSDIEQGRVENWCRNEATGEYFAVYVNE